MPSRRLPVVLALVLFATLGAALWARAEAPPVVLVTIAAPTAAERTALANAGYDVWGADLRSITLAVPAAEARQMQKQVQRQGHRILDAAPVAFPPNFAGYHDYAEMVADLQGLAAQYPDLARLQSIGQSLEGRELWALRITDHPDQNEPDEKGILIYAGAHAREHLTVEQALFMAHDLLDNYGKEGEATNLVNQRDIWILPNLNPDGSEYDIDTAFAEQWRKNRRNNGDGTWGVDLNRNFGYKWGLDNQGSSGWTGDWTYRGPAPFSEPENQALRDFAIAHNHLNVSLSLHTYGELILYPYGYTYAELPPDMKAGDLAIFKALSAAMAARNGYTAQQASDLYVVNGGHDDWFYGDQGIYAMTLELYPRGYPGFYPRDTVIGPQTQRNRSALRYAIALAHDPARSVPQGSGDLTPPTVALAAPGPGDVLLAGAPFSVTVTAGDNAAVTTVEYLVDGEPAAVAVAPDFAATLTLPAGAHTLTARAFDQTHLQTLSEPLQVLAGLPTPTPTATPPPARLYLPLLRAGG